MSETREIGRVASAKAPVVRGGGRPLAPPRPVHVGVKDGLVFLSLRFETVYLDQDKAEEFTRLYFEALRQAQAAQREASDG